MHFRISEEGEGFCSKETGEGFENPLVRTTDSAGKAVRRGKSACAMGRKWPVRAQSRLAYLRCSSRCRLRIRDQCVVVLGRPPIPCSGSISAQARDPRNTCATAQELNRSLALERRFSLTWWLPTGGLVSQGKARGECVNILPERHRIREQNDSSQSKVFSGNKTENKTALVRCREQDECYPDQDALANKTESKTALIRRH